MSLFSICYRFFEVSQTFPIAYVLMTLAGFMFGFQVFPNIQSNSLQYSYFTAALSKLVTFFQVKRQGKTSSNSLSWPPKFVPDGFT